MRNHSESLLRGVGLQNSSFAKLSENPVGVDLHNMGDQLRDTLTSAMVLGPEFQILDPVIGLVSVDVMDGLVGEERPTDVVRHDETMHVGVSLRVGSGVVLSNEDPRVSIGGKYGLDLSPRNLQLSMPKDAGSATRAVPSTVLDGAVAVGVLAVSKWMLTWPALKRAPTLAVTLWRKLARATFTALRFSNFRGHDYYSIGLNCVSRSATFTNLGQFDDLGDNN